MKKMNFESCIASIYTRSLVHAPTWERIMQGPIVPSFGLTVADQ